MNANHKDTPSTKKTNIKPARENKQGGQTVRVSQKTAEMADIIEKKYGPDRGLKNQKQIEQFYKELEKEGWKSLSQLLHAS